jgi:hypothetical protein
LLEMKEDTVERIIERSVSSSAMIELALTQSARSQIHDALYDTQQEYLSAPETYETIGIAQQRRLEAILAETVSSGHTTVTVEQLRRELQKQRAERAAADAYLATKDEDILKLPPATSAPEPVSIKKKSANRRKVEKLVSQYGMSRVTDELDKYASDLKMDARTLQRHLEAISQSA